MLCDRCQNKEAIVHIQEVVGDQKRTVHLCVDCATTQGVLRGDLGGLDLAEMLCDLAGDGAKTAGAAAPSDPDSQRRCEGCGLSWAEFGETGRLGCARCYATFADFLEPALARMHSGCLHCGRKPGEDVGPARSADGGQPEVEVLRRELTCAVAAEAYERAAELRDDIRRIERTEGKKTVG